ncbi:hypothetical protein [Algoriphagus sp.]|uniref:hypothetical protein n=1 Tax=Algoriphagus sp. TaxID=1872435 RepID=UPI0025CCBCE2|nr:hypothetical protein [Algoriphagus sp.]
MKKFQLLIFALFFSWSSFAQNNDSKFWFGFDASYWQRAIHNSNPLDVQRDMLGSIRPMIGLNLPKNWSIGVITNFTSYQEKASPIEYSYPIIGAPIENDDYPIIGYRNVFQQASLKNSLRGYGFFLKKYISLGKKTSINFSLYGMKESGKDGKIIMAPDFGTFGYYYPCINCLSIAYIRNEIPMTETNWKVGFDFAFAYQIKPWLGLEVRANILEYRKQVLKDQRVTNQLIDFAYDPYYGATAQYFGNHYDFGSAVVRDGIRFGLIFSPF